MLPSACAPRRHESRSRMGVFIASPGRLDPSLALDLRDGGLRVGGGLDPRVEEAEVLDGSHEPRGELYDL